MTAPDSPAVLLLAVEDLRLLLWLAEMAGDRQNQSGTSAALLLARSLDRTTPDDQAAEQDAAPGDTLEADGPFPAATTADAAVTLIRALRQWLSMELADAKRLDDLTGRLRKVAREP